MIFDEIRAELLRLNADDVQLQSDERLNRPAASLVKITVGPRSCTVLADGLLEMLSNLSDGAGTTAIESALELRSGRAEAWAIAG
jgi:hypothetical protein